MTEGELMDRLLNGEDLPYYKLTLDRRGHERKTAEETKIYFEDEQWHLRQGHLKRNGIWETERNV
jgi:hypothetical protein